MTSARARERRLEPWKFSTVALAFSGAILIGLAGYVSQTSKGAQQVLAQELRMKEFAGQIAYLDEVLTLSARMAAVTGDLSWEERYGRFEPVLAQAIHEVMAVALGVSREAIAQTEVANRTLAKMEHQAFERVHQGRLSEAYAILFSVDYEAQKEMYAQGIERFLGALKDHAASILSTERQRSFFSVVIVVVVLLLLLVTWTAILWSLQHWQAVLLEKNRELSAQATELIELNRTLDERVAARTEELVQTNRFLTQEINERRALEVKWRAQVGVSKQANEELMRRQRVAHSLLEDLEASTRQLEEQGKLLQASNKRLEGLGAIKDEFVAKVSHELRTPLTSIKEGLSLLLDNALGATTAEQQDFLKTMDGDVDRLTELINNMLDISKIEAGRMRLARARVDLEEMVRSIVRSYQPLLAGRAVRIDCPDMPDVFADHNRVMQVLANLFSNALKVTPAQGGIITFRAAHRNGLAAIAVEDNGCGIAPQDLPKLFQKFSQVSSQGIGRLRGTGLGLVVCKELTELHGGRIEVTSQVGRGTTFTVLLPLYTDDFALAESFRELVDMIPSTDVGQTVCLLAIQANATDRRRLERLADEIKQHLHRGDVVLAQEPSWIVVLALTEVEGVRAMTARLRGALREGAQLHIGGAVYPHDGLEAEALFERAKSRLDQELALTEPPA